MGAAQKIIDKKTLQTLVPFNALSPVHFNEVAQKTVVEEVRAGRVIFKEGDRDNQSVYLLQGEISLVSGNEIVGSITAGSDASRHPLAHQQPRQVTARAKSNVVVARVDSSLLDIMLTWDQSSGYEVAEIDEDQDDDWMTRILQSQAFLKLPPSNIQRLLMLVESIPVKAGEVIIRQGGEGDYFYIIKNGRCMVTRKPSANAKEVKLAELADGDAFGEDALVSDAKRNATITMMTDGVLMRLAKKDFVELLKEPLLNKLNYAEAAAKVAKGATWLDVRLPGEYENVHIPGSRNIPLSALRLEANGLDGDGKYIVCCDTGRRSASAAFVLSQRGFDVYILNDGLGGVPPEALAGASPGVAAEAPAAAAVTAEVVDLKTHAAANAPEAIAPAAVDSGPLAALQDQLASLENEKRSLETAQAKLTARVGDLQEELERVRDEAREQILELEQILADARENAATAQAALQQLEAASGGQEQAGAAARDQVQALEAELAERRVQEERLSGELAALRTRLAEYESGQREHERERDEAAAVVSGLRAEVEALSSQVQQAEAQQARILALETALQDADRRHADSAAQHTQILAAAQAAALQQAEPLQARVRELETALEAAGAQGQRTHVEQLQRIAELDAAVQAATAALEQIKQEAAQSQQALVERHVGELEAAQAAAQQQTETLQARLDALEAARSDLESRLQVADARLAEALQTGEQSHSELRTQLDTLTGELSQACARRDASQAQVDALRGELEGLRHAQSAADAAKAADAAQLRSELDAALAAQAAVAAERDDLRNLRDTATAAQTELHAALTEAQARIVELQAGADSRVAQLQGELEQAGKRIEALGADSGEQVRQLEAALTAARQEHAAAQAEQARLNDAAEQLRTRLTETETRLAAAEAASADALEARRTETAELQERLVALTQATAALEKERDAAYAELDALRLSLQRLEQQHADAASGRDEQLQALDDLRGQLQAAEAAAIAAAAARAEIEARLEQMTAAAQSAQAKLETLTQEHRQALAEAEQRGQAAVEQQVGDLKSELEGARAALARAQSQRGNLENATISELTAARAALETDVARAREALQASQQELAEAESARQALEAELARTKADAAFQQQALSAEFEQLRMVTSADVEAMQKQMQQLKEELQAARRLSAGGSAEDELARLRLLLDEAREEASAARVDAEQWREHALGESQSAAPMTEPVAISSQQTSDELDAMRVQLADIQCRVDEAMALRDKAQQEAAELRQVMQARQQREMAADAAQSAPAPAGRGGLWMGLAAGLLLGVVGAGGALWFGRDTAAPSPDVAALPANPGAQGKPALAAPPATLEAPAPAGPAAAPDAAAAKNAAAPVRTLRDELGDGSPGPRLIAVAAVSFSMGSGNNSLDADERPRREVQLRRFAIGQHEVTFDEYDAFARATGRALPDDKGWGRGRRPVINVSWEEAVAYTQWLSEQTGQRYRLPSEAEWEYAAGAAARTLYWWGNSPGEGRANCFNCGSEWDARLPAPVGSFAANPLGLHDTAGNVAEWVQDCYQPGYQGAPVDGSPRITVGCTRRVVRGGGFNSPANTLRFTKRDQQLASMRADDIGFRVVREL